MNRTFMRTLLVEESFAYGFTIAFWGSGLLLIEEFGLLQTASILAYATGTITGFGLLALAAFGSPVETVDADASPSYHVLAAVHYLAALVPIGVTHYVVAAPLGKHVTLFLSGALVAVCYNVFAALEEGVSVLLRRAEKRSADGG
ncbi:hypothetical protein [Haloarcula salina]|uniref:Uncharacterized protein n=1 Tax=Haloarcula salina TaxID=1429914 RepID=A0AA41G0E9_9EURY|nr:hypothetical protein [Haloarcula salina]MBV0902105.1 hypothetical protein [Haloarcula salina]